MVELLPGMVLTEGGVHTDERGWFCELHNETVWARRGVPDRFVQDNLSYSRKGTLRGLHFQKSPHAQGKLVRVLRGAVYDVAVDIRPESPAFGRWVGVELSDQNQRTVYIPPGFAHGFLVTSEDALFFYKCTAPYHPASEASLLWEDPTLNIAWPSLDVPISLSPKDRAATTWRTLFNTH